MSHLAAELLSLMEDARADYTILWRELGGLVLTSSLNGLASALYPGGSFEETKWRQWTDAWLAELDRAGIPREDAAARMRSASPKYVPREWMLVEAYTAAESGNFALLQELHELFQTPYEEHPQLAAKYYRKADPKMYEGLGKGGTAYMT